MSAAFVAPIRPKGRDRDDVRQRAPARSKPPPAAGTVGDGEPRTKGVRECQRPSWPPSPSEGARRDDVARQPPARSKCPFAAGTARRPRTGCEGCSGMSAAFVAPESVRRGATAMMYLNVLRRGRSHLPPRERSETANRVRRVFGDDRGLRAPRVRPKGRGAMMSLQKFVDCVV